MHKKGSQGQHACMEEFVLEDLCQFVLTQAITATCQNSEGSGWLYRLLGNLSGKKHLLVVDGHTNHTQMSNIGPHGVCVCILLCPFLTRVSILWENCLFS